MVEQDLGCVWFAQEDLVTTKTEAEFLYCLSVHLLEIEVFSVRWHVWYGNERVRDESIPMEVSKP